MSSKGLRLQYPVAMNRAMYPSQSAFGYHRHRPEQTLLYQLVEQHFPAFVSALEANGGNLPTFVRQEFDDYLKCGLLEHGWSVTD